MDNQKAAFQEKFAFSDTERWEWMNREKQFSKERHGNVNPMGGL